MKIIFLDIDGVLNHFGAFAAGLKICPSCVGLLKHLMKETDSQIVVSSTWRRIYSKDEISEKIDLPLLDMTKVLNNERGLEIKEWLDRHPDVERYVVLDDDSDIEPHVKNHVLTSHETGGFNFVAFKKAMDILMIGDLRSALERRNLAEAVIAFQKLTPEEQYSAIQMMNAVEPLFAKYVIRRSSQFKEADVIEVMKACLLKQPEEYIAIGFGRGDEGEYQDGSLPISNEWILVKEMKVYSNDYRDPLWLDLQNAGRRYLGEPSTFDVVNFDDDFRMKILENTVEDWCPKSTYIIVKRNGQVKKYDTWQS